MDSTASAALSARLLRDFEAEQEQAARRAVKPEQPESGRLLGEGPFGQDPRGGGMDSRSEMDPLDDDGASTSFASEAGFSRSRSAYHNHAQSQASASEAWACHPSIAERSASAHAMPPPQGRGARDQSVALDSDQPERKPLLGWYTHSSEPGEQGMRQLATMQARLNERLGPEYISDRQGGGGSRMKYIEGWKAIDLANDVFGFNGWSTSIRKIETPICREKAQGRWDIGVYVVMRVTLRDGTFHEDVGWGQMENSPSLGLGLEKAKKEAVTDALKRSLRTFGRLLGNCLYDKKWVDWVSKVKAPVEKFEMSGLHRRPDLKPSAPQPQPSAPQRGGGDDQGGSIPTVTGSTPEDEADASTSRQGAALQPNGILRRSTTAQPTAQPTAQHLNGGLNTASRSAAPVQQTNGGMARSATSAAQAPASASITADQQAQLQAKRRAEAMERQAKFAQRQQQQQQQRDQTPVSRSPSPTKQTHAPPPAPPAQTSAAAQVFASAPGAKWAKGGGSTSATGGGRSSTVGGLNEADLRAASEAMDLSQGRTNGIGANGVGVTSLSSAGSEASGAAGTGFTSAGGKRLAQGGGSGPRGSVGPDEGAGTSDRRPLGDLELGDDGAVKRQRRA